MSRLAYDEVIANLQQRKNTTYCSDAIKMLTDLGFIVNKSSSGNHHTYLHPGIPEFFGASFDCGHGKAPVIKAVYIGKILKILKKYKEEISALRSGK